jgi:hypothetical protein
LLRRIEQIFLLRTMEQIIFGINSRLAGDNFRMTGFGLAIGTKGGGAPFERTIFL